MKKTLLPIHILILFLTLLTVWSTALWNGNDTLAWILSLQNLALLSIASYGVRLGIHSFIDQNYPARKEHRIITTLILFLLFDSLNPWWAFLALGAVTETVQYFVRTPAGPLFNPAALGLLIISIFGFLPSWWGVNPPPRFPFFEVDISLLAWIIALGAGYVIHRYRKLPIAASAFLSFALAYVIIFQANPSYFLLEGTILFFLFVMVCEPKTSPVTRKEQILYGALVGALVPIGLFFHFLEASLIALLIGNLYVNRRFLTKLLTPAPKSVDFLPTV